MYKFENEKLAKLAEEVKEGWPYFLGAAFTPNAVVEAIYDYGLSERAAVEEALHKMRGEIDDLLERVKEAS